MNKQLEWEVGDYIHTTEILDCEVGGETAQIRKIDSEKSELSVIYGVYHDRAWVSMSSCTFVKKGKISNSDILEPNPFVFT